MPNISFQVTESERDALDDLIHDLGGIDESPVPKNTGRSWVLRHIVFEEWAPEQMERHGLDPDEYRFDD